VRSWNIGVPYGSRTRVAAVKERRPIVIPRNFAAWIALCRTLRTHGNAYWTFNGRADAISAAGDYRYCRIPDFKNVGAALPNLNETT
jgi:hypothetical protein